MVCYSRDPIPSRLSFYGKSGNWEDEFGFCSCGVFGLSIYSISLADPDMIESELVSLFVTLPKRCIVLLEDIDAAGLERSGLGGLEGDQNHAAIHQVSERKPNSHNGLSLSGLLNAIDGVASQEGRVLIMTTNVPEALDPALIRPGRVDMRVHFELANRSHIRELFLSMYADANTNTANSVTSVYEKSSLSTLAESFAVILPPNHLSLAAIQCHLLHYKHDPREAVLTAESWSKTIPGEHTSSHERP